MRFNRISLFQHRLNQNNQHVVTIESKNGGLPIAFRGFFVQARAVKSNGTSNPMGSWDVSGAKGLAKVTDTLYLIRQSNDPANLDFWFNNRESRAAPLPTRR